MGFYAQPKERRDQIVARMLLKLSAGLKRQDDVFVHSCASNPDTHLRKWTYVLMGRLYKENAMYRKQVLAVTNKLVADTNFRVRQTAVYIAGEIGDFKSVSTVLEKGLIDQHHAVRNGVIGALKTMGKRNPKPTIVFAKRHLHERDPEIRRQIVHGIELRGRTHPEDILPLLRVMQGETSNRVRKMVAHVLGQCSYKEGCLEKVLQELSQWKDRDLVLKAIDSILQVHHDQIYCYYSLEKAEEFVKNTFGRAYEQSRNRKRSG
jgi:3-methyladenine DNA glycosylase AlkD